MSEAPTQVDILLSLVRKEQIRITGLLMQIAAYEKVIFNLAQELSAEKASHAETKALAEKNSAEQAAKLAENEKKITTLEKQALIAARDVAQLKDAWEWSEREARSFESELENLRGY